MRLVFILILLEGLLGLLVPLPALAQVGALPGLIDGIVGTNLPTTISGLPTISCTAPGIGACVIASLFVYVVQRGRFLIGALALVLGIAAAFRLIISQSEEAIAQARRTIVGLVIGIFLVFLSEPIVEGFYGGFALNPNTILDSPGQAQIAGRVITTEMLGVLAWIETLVGIVAIGLIIVQAVSVMGSFGSEDRIRKAYRAVAYTIFGILLLVFDHVFALVAGLSPTDAVLPTGPQTSVLFNEMFGFLRFILIFVAIVIVGVILYAGALMLVHYGNEELITRARNTLLNAAIGLILVIVSFTIVSTIILGI